MDGNQHGKRVVFRGARIFDGDSAQLIEGADVVVNGGSIEDVTSASAAFADADVVECGGGVLMPGFIDAHVHVYAAGLNLTRLSQQPMSYLAQYAALFLHACLDRGFTTVRDVGGADVGLASAIRDGLLRDVPRLFYGGRVISQTGGHGDFRPGDHALDGVVCCGCGFHNDPMAVVADGVDAVRRAVREELRRGASHIKIMASGGIASPTDPLERCQYSDEEIRAAVDEAERVGKYVAAHCHPAIAVRRAAELGIRSIEHCTLMDRESADVMATRGAFAVPTMATLVALREEGKELGLPQVSVDKLARIGDAAFRSLEILRSAGVRMGLGTDLLGAQHVRQSTEFTLRAQVLPVIDVLRSACAVNAELLGEAGRLGCIRKGAAADLVLIDGDPLQDISLLGRGERLAVIMKEGQFHKRAV
ncbi:MAG TPA: amidohydrolase family protein [Terracidiphilus sp.]|jgi:imidazolonepropionase-like amidohydrolase